MKLSSKRANFTLEDMPGIINDVRESRCFGRSTRQMKLFEYLLKNALEGTSSDVTQYSVAFDILNRPSSFDPATDSIVRVELHRLRANLVIYNNSASDYNITVPSASFEVIAVPRVTSLTAIWRKHSKVFVLVPLLAVAAISLGFASLQFAPSPSLVVCAQDVPNLRVTYSGEPSETKNYVESILRSTIAQSTGFNVLEKNQNCESNAAPVFNVQLVPFEQNNAFNLALNVIDAHNNSIVDSYHVTDIVPDTQRDTALYFQITRIANSITKPSGTLARYAYKGLWNSNEYQKSYGCLIAMYDSYAGEIDSQFENIHGCLEESVKSGFASLDNYGALAANYLDQARNNRPSTDTDPFKAASNILDKYGERWMDSREIAISKIYYEIDRSDFNSERFEMILEDIQAKYRASPEVLLMVAASLGYSLGKWDEAKNLSDYVKKIYPVRDQSVYTADAGYAFMRWGVHRSMDDCYKYYGENSIFINIIVNACARRAENETWIKLTEENLTRLKVSDYAERLVYLDARVADPEFRHEIREIYEHN